MKAVIQRVESASVKVDGKTVGSCKKGYMILFGAAQGDTERKPSCLQGKRLISVFFVMKTIK